MVCKHRPSSLVTTTFSFKRLSKIFVDYRDLIETANKYIICILSRLKCIGHIRQNTNVQTKRSLLVFRRFLHRSLYRRGCFFFLFWSELTNQLGYIMSDVKKGQTLLSQLCTKPVAYCWPLENSVFRPLRHGEIPNVRLLYV